MEPTLARLLGEPIQLTLAPPSLRCTVRMDPRLFELLLISSLMHLRARLGGAGHISLDLAPATLDLAHATELALPVGEYVRLRASARAAPTPAPEHRVTPLRLALARTIAAMAGGGLHLSADDQPLHLDLHLPRVFTAPRLGEPPPLVDLRGAERLLLLEDDPLLAQTLRAVLTHLGYDLVVADDPRAAIDLLQSTCPPGQPQKQPSLALLSTALPAPAELLRQLRAAWPDLRVLWLATTPGATAPLGDPLVIPCSFEALALRVRQALDARMT